MAKALGNVLCLFEDFISVPLGFRPKRAFSLFHRPTEAASAPSPWMVTTTEAMERTASENPGWPKFEG